MCRHLKMCHETEKMETLKYKKMERGNGANMTARFIRGVFKWGKRDVSINGRVLPVPCTCPLKMTSTESITTLGCILGLMQRGETKSVLLSFLSIFLSLPVFFSSSPIHTAFESSHLRGKGFSYFCLSRHVRGLGVSALFSGARHFLLQMKTKIHPPG